jgi:hypothetical protein
MNAYNPIASGNLYQPYLDAARQNLEALLKLADDFSDLEFRDAADSLLTAFNDYGEECQRLIDAANTHPTDESDLAEYPTGMEARLLANRSVAL